MEIVALTKTEWHVHWVSMDLKRFCFKSYWFVDGLDWILAGFPRVANDQWRVKTRAARVCWSAAGLSTAPGRVLHWPLLDGTKGRRWRRFGVGAGGGGYPAKVQRRFHFFPFHSKATTAAPHPTNLVIGIHLEKPSKTLKRSDSKTRIRPGKKPEKSGYVCNKACF